MNTRERLAFLRRQTEPDMQRHLGADMLTQLRAVVENAPTHTDLSGLQRAEEQEYRYLWTNLKVRLTRLLPNELASKVEQLIELTPRRILEIHLRAAAQSMLGVIGVLGLLHFIPLPPEFGVLAALAVALSSYLGVWNSETHRYVVAARALNARVTLTGLKWNGPTPARGRMVNRRA